MPRATVVLLLIAACTLPALAGQEGAMPVTATVVNTCFFGAQARCHLPGTPLWVQPPGLADKAPAAVARRVVHL